MNIFGTILLVVLAAAAVFFFMSWIVMLLWGALGCTFGFFTIDFWAACLVTITLWVLGGFLSVIIGGGSTVKSKWD